MDAYAEEAGLSASSNTAGRSRWARRKEEGRSGIMEGLYCSAVQYSAVKMDIISTEGMYLLILFSSSIVQYAAGCVRCGASTPPLTPVNSTRASKGSFLVFFWICNSYPVMILLSPYVMIQNERQIVKSSL